MIKLTLLAPLAVLLQASCAIALELPPPRSAPPTWQLFLPKIPARQSHPQEVAQACCKRCSTGKACGNSCISRSKQCHAGAGCACND